MTRDNIVQMLKDYRMIKANIQRLKVEVADIERSGTATQWIRMDALSQLQSPQIDGMPRANTVSSPTEKIALGQKKEVALALERLNAKRLDEKQAELFILQRQKHAIEIMLACLYDKERFVVEEHLVAGLTWTEIGKRHMERYGTYLSRRAGQERQSKAVEKMEKMFR